MKADNIQSTLSKVDELLSAAKTKKDTPVTPTVAAPSGGFYRPKLQAAHESNSYQLAEMPTQPLLQVAPAYMAPPLM
jgi:hypothetical protein